MAEVDQERRKVFEIQIESLRAVGQSIVGALGNMNLLEATLKPSSELDQLASKSEPSLHSRTFASTSFWFYSFTSEYLFNETFFLPNYFCLHSRLDSRFFAN